MLETPEMSSLSANNFDSKNFVLTNGLHVSAHSAAQRCPHLHLSSHDTPLGGLQTINPGRERSILNFENFVDLLSREQYG